MFNGLCPNWNFTWTYNSTIYSSRYYAKYYGPGVSSKPSNPDGSQGPSNVSPVEWKVFINKADVINKDKAGFKTMAATMDLNLRARQLDYDREAGANGTRNEYSSLHIEEFAPENTQTGVPPPSIRKNKDEMNFTEVCYKSLATFEAGLDQEKN
jgi:hypothetical protein